MVGVRRHHAYRQEEARHQKPALLTYACSASTAAFPLAANSGQIRCQSSGRRSRRVTAPSVATSMAAQRSAGIFRRPSRQKHTAWGVTWIARASADALPTFWMAAWIGFIPQNSTLVDSLHQQVCLMHLLHLFKVLCMALGKQVKFYREKLDLTLEQLEEISGVGTGTISALEVRDSVRSKFAPALAAAFGLSVEQLLDESRDWLDADAHSQNSSAGGPGIGQKVTAISDLAATELWTRYQHASRAVQLVVDLAIGRPISIQDEALRQSVQAAISVAAASFPKKKQAKQAKKRTGSAVS